MIFVGITINSFSQRGYEIIELLCFEILGGTLMYGGFSGGTGFWFIDHAHERYGPKCA